MNEGGCACGEIRYRLTSDPLFTHCCHCLNCQRQTGSAFVINVLIETDRLELLAGEPQPVDVPRDGGMADMTVLDYAMMIEDSHVDTRLVEYRRRGPDTGFTGRGIGSLLAVALDAPRRAAALRAPRPARGSLPRQLDEPHPDIPVDDRLITTKLLARPTDQLWDGGGGLHFGSPAEF